MAAAFFSVICVSLLFVNTISAQCQCGYGNRWNPTSLLGAELAAAELGAFGGYRSPAFAPAPTFAPSPAFAPAPAIYTGPSVAQACGGNFAVSVSSPLAPRGITILSENAIDGTLDVMGSLPLLSTVGFESILPTTGSAGVSYGCGNGNVGMSAESLAAVGLGGLAPARPLARSSGYAPSLAGPRYAGPARSCGCGGLYY